MTPPAMTSAGRGSTAKRPASKRAPANGSASPRPVAARSAPLARPSGRPLTTVPRRVSGPVRRGSSAVREQSRRSRLLTSSMAFAGIVATQVEVLKLGASMGRWVQRSAALTSRNQSLQASVAALSDDQRIERMAARTGMVMPAPTAITFLPAHSAGGVRVAVGRLQPPDSTQFLASLPPAGYAATSTAVVTGAAAVQQTSGG